MAGKKYTYQIGITADTSQFETQMKRALESLNKLSTAPQIALSKTSATALELADNIKSAVNESTGKFDLSMFNDNLKASGKNLEDYAYQLSMLGPDGEQAFMQVAEAITSAEMPLMRTNKLMDSLWTTMKNTMRWQLTSSMLQGFTSAVSHAYGYTQDLNESLNSIRIVTQKSAEDMAAFAEQANKAAQSLSTTTTDYTDASLIYFQQGLDDEAVQERTEATIKFANVSAQSAETASEQLTAVWNNFDDGSKSLEYYVDVMTALGATTASSSQEIAEGLEKFAAIGESVGLSYEYATSALATVTATTRQSADVVGTAFKTLFARIQDLSLGETLDDGVTLDTYSKALYQVGVNIIDANGELKDMDNILDELGQKWGEISSSQQVALAQTVAGTRQYTQLMALMNNWSDFQNNLKTAYASEGTLQKQANIYAESWEAARDRVTAASEDIYDSLINEDFFINLDNIFTPILSGIANVIDAAGGMQGVFSISAALMSKAFGNKMSQSIRDVATSLSFVTKEAQQQAIATQEQAADLVISMNGLKDINADQNRILELKQQEMSLEAEINKQSLSLDESTKAIIEKDLQRIKNLETQAQLYADQKKSAQELADQAEFSLKSTRGKRGINATKVRSFVSGSEKQNVQDLLEDTSIFTENAKLPTIISNLANSLKKLSSEAGVQESSLSAYQELENTFGTIDEKSLKALQSIKEFSDVTSIDEATSKFNQLSEASAETEKKIEAVKEVLKYILPDKFSDNIENFDQETRRAAMAEEGLSQSTEAATKRINEESEGLVTGSLRVKDFASKTTEAIQALSSLSVAFNGIKTLGSLFDADDLTTAEKLIQGITALTMVIPPLIQSQSSLNRFFEETGIQAKADQVAFNLLGKTLAFTISGNEAAATSTNLLGSSLKNLASTTTIGITVLTTLYTVISKVVEKQREAAEKAYQAQINAAKAAQEEVESNKQLLTSMQEALESYQESGENKDALDEATRNLAEAYQIEGAALAKLSGNYDDYVAVLNKAKGAQEKAIANEQDAIDTAINAAGEQMWSTAKEGINYGIIGGTYRGSFSGSGAEESKAYEALQKNVSSNYVTSNGLSTDTFQFAVDKSNPDELVELYDQVNAAIDEMVSSMSAIELSESGIYQKAVAWRDNLTDTVETYKELQESQDVLNLERGESFQGISTYEDYADWVNQVTENLAKQGRSEEEISNIIAAVASGSTVSKFNDIYNAVKDVKDIITDEELKGSVDDYFSDDKYDASVLASMNWATLTASNFKNAYKNAAAYQEALEGTTNATNKLASAQAALDALGDGTFTSESLAELASSFDWGNAEEGIISFEDFLSRSVVEQKAYLQDLINRSYEGIAEGSVAQLEILQQQLADAQADLEQDKSSEEYTQAEQDKEAWGLAKQAYEDYQEAIRNGEEFTLSEEIASVIQEISHKDWQDLFKELSNGSSNAIEEGIEDADLVISKVEAKESAVNDLQDKIESAEYNITVNAKLNYQNQLTQIENSVDDLVSVFDAIDSGVTQVTNSAGEQVWSVSLESAKAIESVYSGFMSTAKLLEDGTFELTDEIYQRYFDTSNGILAIDAKTKAGILNDNIAQLEAEKASAEASLKIAEDLASGDLLISSLTNTEKEQLLSSYRDAQALNNGDMLEDEVNLLATSNTNWATLYDNIEDYAGQGATGMANNIAQGTTSVLENMEKIRSAAYTASQEIQHIGDTTWGGTAKISSVASSLADVTSKDIELLEGFIEDLGPDLNKINEEDSEWDLHGYNLDKYKNQKIKTQDYTKDESKAIGRAAKRQISEYIDSLNASIAANKAAVSKLLSAATLSDTDSDSGSSGSTKTYDKEDLDTLDDIIDRYHEVNRQIERQNDLLEDLEENTERAFGLDKVKGYEAEIEALSKQYSNYQDKLNFVNQHLTEDKAALIQVFGEDIFAENGELFSYNNLRLQSYRAVEEAVESYNAAIDAGSSEEIMELLKENVDTAKEKYENEIKLLDTYEDDIDEMRDVQDNMEENLRKQADKALDAIDYKLEVTISVKDLKKQAKQLSKEIAESYGDELTHGIQSAQISYEMAQIDISKLETYQENYNDLMEQWAKATNQADKERIQDSLKDLQSQAISTAEELIDYAESLETMFSDALDAASQRYAKFTDQLEHNQTVLSSIKELYALQGVTYKTTQGYNTLQKVAQEKLNAQIAEGQVLKAKYENLGELLAEAEANLVGVEETDAAYDTLKANRDALLEEYNSTQEELLEKAQEAMETTQEIYTTAIEKLIDDYDKAISGGLGLDLLSEKYDHYIEEEERYLDKVNEAYEVSSWYNKLQADIDDTTNSKYKEQLKALQEQIDVRREGNTLSEYDLDILEAQYKVLQAQMALEDAENDKSQLRLVRDSQGNWNYQYTADANSIADAEQNLLDANNDLYNIAKKQVKEMSSEIISTMQDCEEEVSEIYQQMADGTLTYEEAQAKLTELTEYYNEKIKYLENEKQIAIKDMTDAGNQSLIDNALITGDKVSDITGITSEDIQKIIKNSDSSIISLLTSDSETLQNIVGDNTKLVDQFDNTYAKDLNDMTSNSKTFKEKLDSLLDELEEAWQDYQGSVKEVADKTGTSMDDLSEYTSNVATSTDEVRDAALDAESSLRNLLGTVQDLSAEYATLAKNAKAAASSMGGIANDIATNYATASGVDETTDNTDYSMLMYEEYLKGNAGYSEEYKNYMALRDQKIASGYTGYGQATTARIDALLQRADAGDPDAQKLLNRTISNGKYFTDISRDEWIKVVGFDTGGYTGEFNDKKLAFLDEKELILNKSDTENILTAVQTIRSLGTDVFAQIEKILDGNASAGIALMASALQTSSSPTLNNGTLEQNIRIEHVEFPNVTSSSEIEDAFASIVNDASQWAKRKKS